MTGMPRKFRPIIGSRWVDPTLDNPILRRMPIGWELEKDRPKIPAWSRLLWRLFGNPERLIFWVCMVILAFAALTAVGAFEARAADKPQFRKDTPINPVWTAKRCRDQGRTYHASSSDGRAWKVRCTGRPVRT